MEANNQEFVAPEKCGLEISTVSYFTTELNDSHRSQGDFSYCRTCGNGHEYYIQIYSDEGKNHGLADKINRHLPIMVSESDALPTQICYQCASTLLAYNDLIDVCSNADKRFRCLYGYDDDRIPLNSKTDEGEHLRNKNDSDEHRSQESITNLTSDSNENKSRVGETQDQVFNHEDHNYEQREYDQFEDSDEVDGVEEGGESDFDDGGVIKKRRRKKDSISKCSICGRIFQFVEPTHSSRATPSNPKKNLLLSSLPSSSRKNPYAAFLRGRRKCRQGEEDIAVVSLVNLFGSGPYFVFGPNSWLHLSLLAELVNYCVEVLIFKRLSGIEAP
ncbi:hypothetical protein GE061_000612 [Apolygus lucorum]|uniref:ZAD domain-containing protein n=1 Tax=Apolygus lucorum TaxID=248454 RepID=A0A8S9Y4S5_APOLU|nr:hypothetical protein GE061_000612 [Apolygus lucorum]